MSFRRRSEGLGRAKVACDACRHKKAKCDGLVPCTRCRDGRNDDICCYSRRIESSEQVFSALYVKMLRRQLHITLSSLRFLVERIALDKDCRTYVPDIDTPINTIISLIQDSPEFDEEQGKEFSEMSDSELTMLSPQELPADNDELKENAAPGETAASQAVKAESSQPKPPQASMKRKNSEAHDPCEEHLAKPVRGRPRKAKRSQSGSRPVISVNVPSACGAEPAAPPISAHPETSAPRSSSTSSTLLTPVSVRSDTGEESPTRLGEYPVVPLPRQGRRSVEDHENYSFQFPKGPVYSHPDYQSSAPPLHNHHEVLNMDSVFQEEHLAGPPPLSHQPGNHVPDSGTRWAYQGRVPYEAPAYSDSLPDIDYFAVDECLPTWPLQGPPPPTMVSLNELEYQMPS